MIAPRKKINIFEKRRRAFTLVELLVVIAIIGILVGLLLPAVQAAREAARRMQCQNNVKQLHLAIANYESAFKKFPMGVLVTGYQGPGGPGVGYRNVFSWLAYSLPYLEQNNVAVKFNYNVFALGAENAEAGATTIPSFLCPSDPQSERDPVWAPTNYRGCIGSNGNRFTFNGVFGANLGMRHRDMVDGASNTLGISESIRSDYKPETLRDNHVGSRAAGVTAEDIETCQSLPATFSDRGGSWITGVGVHVFFSADRPPNDKRLDCWGPELGTTNFCPRSFHTGGAVAANMDGNVRVVSNNIDRTIFRAMGTRAGGEVAIDE